jgi:hypothetical protein
MSSPGRCRLRHRTDNRGGIVGIGRVFAADRNERSRRRSGMLVSSAMEDCNMNRGFILALGLLGTAAFEVAVSLQAGAAPVGETHRVATEPTASLRDAQHRPELRITIWYPAASDAVESPMSSVQRTACCSKSGRRRRMRPLPMMKPGILSSSCPTVLAAAPG